MAIKAKGQITLSSVVDVKATYRYYLLQASTLEKPSKPTTYPPESPWDDSESSATSLGFSDDGTGNVTSSLILSDDGEGNVTIYDIGHTDSLYFVDCTVFCDGTYQYSEVSLLSSYEAAKTAYNRAFNAQNSATDAMSTASDAQTRISSAESLIEVLSESISMLVTDSNGASLMTQTDTGWTFSTAGMQAIVDRTSEELNNLTSDVGDVNNAVSILQQAVKDLGTIAEYVKIGTYEDEPCIELGEGDSDFKLLITNTRIMFREGASVPAYFNNQSMHISKAVVEEELQQGGFVWTVRGNGNLGLIWKGGVTS